MSATMTGLSPAQYMKALMAAQIVAATGLCGRIIRGKKPDDFTTLTDDPHRKLVMLMGPDGLELLCGKNGHDMLVAIGYEPTYIQHKVQDGNQFKLAVFSAGDQARPATWDNVVDIVSETYPDVADKLECHRTELNRLSHTNFADLERQAGFDFSEVDKVGPSEPRYMTHERFRDSAGTLLDARSFLYFTIHLREQFAGDGYTYDDQGNRGLMEYIVPNIPLADLEGHELLDLTIELPNPKGNTMPQATAKRVALPPYFDPANADKVYRVDYQARAIEARAWAKKHGIKVAAKDTLKIVLLIIDAQNTFSIPGYELYVGGQSGRGAVEDNTRLAQFILVNLGVITKIKPTLDTHTTFQIFHQDFLINDQGEHPTPFSMVTLDEIKQGKWKANPAMAPALNVDYMWLQSYVRHYAQTLADRGKYALTIWPYHAKIGGIGHALASIIEEACFFHEIARISPVEPEIKGGNPLFENYSILAPEVMNGPNNTNIGAQRNTRLIKTLMEADRVLIAGQAKSHCVAWTIDDLLTDINAKDPDLAQKVYLLEDCTSPVVVPGVIDYTDEANAAFDRFKQAGMHVVKSTDPIGTWPNMSVLD